MFRLTELSLRNRAVVALVSIAILVGGMLSVRSLKMEMLPSIELPSAVVTATNEGVSPELIEAQLQELIEGAIAAVPGVETVTTTSVDSTLYSLVRFRYGTHMDTVNQKLSTSINRLQRQLPSEVQTTVMTGSMDDWPIITVAVRGSDLAELDRMVNEVLAPRLGRLENVRTVTVTGFSGDEIIITPDSDQMAENMVSMELINRVLTANGVILPAGRIQDSGRELVVEAGSEITSLEELIDLPLFKGPDGTVTLGDVAAIVQGAEQAKSYSRLEGQTAVSLSVTKTPEGNTVDVSRLVKEAVAALDGSMDQAGLKSAVVFDQAPFIEDSINGLLEEGLLGLGFAIIVILVFLFSVRATLVSAVSIPLSLLMAFIALNSIGETLNVLTLGAITMAIGRVVDDSIVVIENIKRHLSYGVDKWNAIVGAVRQVGGAVASSTLCMVAVFVPLAFTKGMVGELFRPFGWTVALALAGSLIVSLTIVPVLAYWFVKAPVAIDSEDRELQRSEAEERERQGFWQRLYMPSLRAAIRHPAITLAFSALLLEGTVVLFPSLETNFLGDMGS
ncbi:MAG: efflux RND transporter permease subunit, partial [Bifidobacteriaceae bacterium]|nr:efflux RND transporter permease subunit [Bifidobacteriaceae bacterium]